MKPQRLLAFVLGGLSACFFWGGCCKLVYPTFPIAYDTNQLVGAWIGFNDSYGTTSYLMILQQHGTGILYSEFDNEPADTNRIVAWGLEDDGVTFHFQRSGPSTSPALLKCALKTDLLVGKLVGKGGWTENVIFLRPAFVEESLKRLNALEGER